MYYTGIGSRETPRYICILQTYIAKKLYAAGYTLRSGAADGSDTAFEDGAGDRKHIYLPWDTFNNRFDDGIHYLTIKRNWARYKDCVKLVNDIHPRPTMLSPGAMQLHVRNIPQVSGHEREPLFSEFVLYYANIGPDGFPEGGTRTAVCYAMRNNVPCYNLKDIDTLSRIITRCDNLKPLPLAGEIK